MSPHQPFTDFGFDGTVEFDINVPKPETDSTQRIRGKFPRIKPKIERNRLTSTEQLELENSCWKWVKEHFETIGRENYIQGLVRVSCLMAAYMDPWNELHSPTMELEVKAMCWAWIADDMPEEAHILGISLADIQLCSKALLEYANYKNENLLTMEEEVNPYFRSLVTSLLSMRELFLDVPQYNQEWLRFEPYRVKYNEACKLLSTHPEVRKAKSEEMFRYWRNICAYLDGVFLTYALIHNMLPSDEVLKSPEIPGILDLLNQYGGSINDMLGVNKDLERGEDNVIIYKMETRKISLEEAVKEVCDKLEEDLSEYVLLKQAILEKYPEQDKFMKMLECTIDAQNRIYSEEDGRYGIRGTIKLLRGSSKVN